MATTQAPSPQDRFALLETVVPSWGFTVPVGGFLLSANPQAEIDRIQLVVVRSLEERPVGAHRQRPSGCPYETALEWPLYRRC